MTQIEWKRFSATEERATYGKYLLKKKFVGGKWVYQAWVGDEMAFNGSYYAPFMQKVTHYPATKTVFGWEVGIK